MEEIWKDIKGFEGRYQVSNLGRIRSLGFKWKVYNHPSGRYIEFNRKGKILKLRIGKRFGYCEVNLANMDGIIKTYRVHRLVANTFLPNPNNLPIINHKDENKTNNVVCFNPDGSIDTDHTNLEWCTSLYNLRYGTRVERMQKAVNEPRMRPVNQYDFDGNLLHTYHSIAEASRETGISRRSISHVCKNTFRHSANGYVFRYSDDDTPWVYFDKSKCQGNKERMRAVDQYDLNGNFIRSYESIQETSRATGVSSREIGCVLSGKRKTTHGFVFRYHDDNSK